MLVGNSDLAAFWEPKTNTEVYNLVMSLVRIRKAKAKSQICVEIEKGGGEADPPESSRRKRLRSKYGLKDRTNTRIM